MYNEHTKLSFIEDYSQSVQSRALLRQIFNGIEFIEQKYNVDFCSMDSSQAQEAYSRISGMRARSAGSYLAMLRSYVKWCRARGYLTSDAVYGLRIDFYEKIREKMVASPAHLKLALDAAFPNPARNEIEYIYRSFLWLAYMGFMDIEAVRVRCDEIFLAKHIIRFSGNTEDYHIYMEAEHDLSKACSLREFKEPRGKDGVYKQRAVGDLLLRGKVTANTMEESISKTFRPTITRAFKNAVNAYEAQGSQVPKHLSLGLTYNSIYLSGIFYRAYERERMGIPPRFDAIVIRERSYAPASNYSRNYTLNKQLNSMINDMEKDYLNWKSVHT